MERILLCKPKMCGREIDFIKAALAEDWAVPLGPDCDAFETELEWFVGEGKKVASLVSGTAAIHLALIACGVEPGDEVAVQSLPSARPQTRLHILEQHLSLWIPRRTRGTWTPSCSNKQF